MTIHGTAPTAAARALRGAALRKGRVSTRRALYNQGNLNTGCVLDDKEMSVECARYNRSVVVSFFFKEAHLIRETC